MTTRTAPTAGTTPGTDLTEAAARDLYTSPLAALADPTRGSDRLGVARYAFERVDLPGFLAPVPRIFGDLPRASTTDDDVSWDITVRGLASADPLTSSTGGQLKLSEMVGGELTVHDLAVRPLTEADMAETPDRRIGAYLVLDVTTDDPGDHRVVFSGSPAVIGPVVFAWARGQLPHTWFVVETAAAKGKRSAPLGLRNEPAL